MFSAVVTFGSGRMRCREFGTRDALVRYCEAAASMPSNGDVLADVVEVIGNDPDDNQVFYYRKAGA